MGVKRLEPLDWRYSSAIVGLSKYLKHYNCDFKITEDYLEFEENDISEENYLYFAEYIFSRSMHHVEIQKNIDVVHNDKKQEIERIKFINEKMNGNTILKKVFSKIKYDGTNGEEIKKRISDNRLEIIKNTYKSGRSLYYNFCNDNQLFNDSGKVCRVNGYYIDMGKKSKGNSYGFNTKTYVFNDDRYFDFIPFGFSKDREAFFINNNVNVKDLIAVNIVEFDEKIKNPLRSDILLNSKNSVNKIEYDVEVIVKDREKDYFETLYIRKESMDIFNKIEDKTREILQKPCNAEKITGFSSSEYIPVEKIVTNSILNLTYLDNLIEFLFKYSGKKYLNSHLITINRLIYKEGKDMSYSHRDARDDAFRIKAKFSSKGNKLRAYEQRLVTAISLKDYDKVKEILIHLSSYTQLPIRALIPLCENFEKNKNLAYTFINSLGEKEKISDENGEGNNGK